MYTPESVAVARNTANIVDIVGEVVNLKKAGVNLQGLCPFHQEKSPSFTVSPVRNTYHCFGCGVGGDAVDFLIRRGKTFRDAIKSIADRYNVPLVEQYGREVTEANHDLRTQLRATASVLQGHFAAAQSEAAAKYWTGRGLTQETCDQFGLGYCDGTKPPHVTDEALRSIGGINEAGNLIFYKRSTIPIHDALGNVCAWGARAIEGDTKAKYINSPETEIYTKRWTWYNLHRATPHIRQKQEVWIVEGYMDCMALWQWGIHNAVALCGTAITSDHITVLRRFNGDKPLRIILALDNETGGDADQTKAAVKKAYRAAVEMLLPVGEVLAVSYPKKIKDMGDTLTARLDPASFQKKDAISTWVEHNYPEDMDKASPSEIAAFQEETAKLLALVKRDNVRDVYINQLSTLLRISPRSLEKIVREIRTEGESTQKNRKADEWKYIKVADDYFERQINYDIFTKSSQVIYVRRKRQELCSEGVAVNSLKRFHNWICEPSHLKYRRVVEIHHEGDTFSFFNSYQPLPFLPKEFDLPANIKSPDFDAATLREIQNIGQFYKHIFDFERYGTKYLQLGLDWTALCYLEPTQRLPAMALVSSEEGTGKSTFINLHLAMFGENACKTDALRIGQNFNAMSAGKLLTCVEETKDQRGDIENKLKDLITSFEKVVEAKHQDAKVVKAFDKFIFASNHEDSFMKVGTETTRFFVMKVRGISQKQPDFEDKLYREIPYFLYFLQKRGVLTPKTDRLWFDPRLLENEALLKLRHSSKDQVQQVVEDFISDLWLRCQITTPYIYLTSQQLKLYMTAYGGKTYDQKTPTYFQKVANVDMRLHYDDSPKRRDTVELSGIHSEKWITQDNWEYDTKRLQARFVEFPIWKFIKPVDIQTGYYENKRQELFAALAKCDDPRAQDLLQRAKICIQEPERVGELEELPF